MLNINKMEQFSATVSKICNVKKPKQAENKRKKKKNNISPQTIWMCLPKIVCRRMITVRY